MVIIFKPFLGGKFNPNYEETEFDLIPVSLPDYYDSNKLIINKVSGDSNSVVVMIVDYLDQKTFIDFSRIDRSYINTLLKDNQSFSLSSDNFHYKYLHIGIKKYLRDRNIKSLLG